MHPSNSPVRMNLSNYQHHHHSQAQTLQLALMRASQLWHGSFHAKDQSESGAVFKAVYGGKTALSIIIIMIDFILFFKMVDSKT